MTGREKIKAAFSKGGTSEIPAVICYEGIYVRDHWQELVSVPWWYQEVPDIECQMLWRREVIEKIGQDWFGLPLGYSREVTAFQRLRGTPAYEQLLRADPRRHPWLRGGWTPAEIAAAQRAELATLRGAGDVVARATGALGIAPCEPCERRRRTLNRWFRF